MKRNESADLVRDVWAGVVENSPEATNSIRLRGALGYVSSVLSSHHAETIHSDHFNWLVNALNDVKTQNLIDTLAARARIAGGPLEVPWRD